MPEPVGERGHQRLRDQLKHGVHRHQEPDLGKAHVQVQRVQRQRQADEAEAEPGEEPLCDDRQSGSCRAAALELDHLRLIKTVCTGPA